MLRISCFAIAAALACGPLADSARAKPPGGGGNHHSGGGNHSGGGHHSGHDGHHHSSVIIGIGGFPRYFGYGSYYGGPGYYSGRSYYYDPEPPPVVLPSGYEQPPPVTAEPEPSSDTEIRVLLPTGQAQVWVDGLRSSSTEAVRLFGFPNERPGKSYLHKITVSWMREGKPVTQEREVQVTGGKTTVVDFRARADRLPPPPTPREENP
jgi:uncharacterized protein (TIGR03000 family)